MASNCAVPGYTWYWGEKGFEKRALFKLSEPRFMKGDKAKKDMECLVST